MAAPNTVVIGASTRRLLGELFEYRALGTIPVKDFAHCLPVWQVTGASAVDSRFEALRTASTPLVGRELLIRAGDKRKARKALWC